MNCKFCSKKLNNVDTCEICKIHFLIEQDKSIYKYFFYCDKYKITHYPSAPYYDYIITIQINSTETEIIKLPDDKYSFNPLDPNLLNKIQTILTFQ